jgi:hypothetical protein
MVWMWSTEELSQHRTWRITLPNTSLTRCDSTQRMVRDIQSQYLVTNLSKLTNRKRGNAFFIHKIFFCGPIIILAKIVAMLGLRACLRVPSTYSSLNKGKAAVKAGLQWSIQKNARESARKKALLHAYGHINEKNGSTVLQTTNYTTQKVSTEPSAKSPAFPDHSMKIINPGTYTLIQDFPGREGLWRVGVPPSGPMDDYSFRLANALVGNEEGAAGLELAFTGPTIQFNRDTFIAITGAQMQAELDGKSVPCWTSVAVKKGSTLKLGKVEGHGVRTYLAVAGKSLLHA